jgi:hypothetical protein
VGNISELLIVGDISESSTVGNTSELLTVGNTSESSTVGNIKESGEVLLYLDVHCAHLQLMLLSTEHPLGNLGSGLFLTISYFDCLNSFSSDVQVQLQGEGHLGSLDSFSLIIIRESFGSVKF